MDYQTLMELQEIYRAINLQVKEYIYKKNSIFKIFFHIFWIEK
jgi:hypothetical protein